MNNADNAPTTLKEAVQYTHEIEALTYQKEPVSKETDYFLGNKQQKNRLKNIVNLLEQSEHGKHLINTANEKGYMIALATGIEDQGVCSYDRKLITINENTSDELAVSILAHELRHACQYINGINLHANSDNTKTQIQINRAMEADAETNACFAMMELKAKGFDKPLEEFKKDGSEIFKSITEEIAQSGDDLKKNKSKLLLAGFKGWYNDFNIREIYDSQQIDLLDKIREEKTMEMVGFDRSCPTSIIIEKICKTPEQGNYFDDNQESHELLNSRHYLGISKINMDLLIAYFKERQEKHNIQPDTSLPEIPTYHYKNEKKGHKRGNTKSVYWEPIIKIKNNENENKKLAIEENKKRYLTQSSMINGSNSLAKDNSR